MTEIRRRKVKNILITVVILMTAVSIVTDFIQKRPEDEKQEKQFGQILGQVLGNQMQLSYFILPVFLEEENALDSWGDILLQTMTKKMPLYHYMLAGEDTEQSEDDKLEALIRAREGSDEDRKEIEEANLDYDENALHIEKSMMEEMQRENDKFLEEEDTKEENSQIITQEQSEGQEIEEAKVQEEAETVKESGFQRAVYPAYTYDWSENWGYEELISNFYAIDNTTSLQEEYVSLDKLLYRDLTIQKNEDEAEKGPQILLYHTHSQEGFADSVPGDASTTIVGAGAKLAKLLEEEYGFRVLHHTGEYDVENRDYAYSNSLPAIEQLLLENPSIEVVIDLHRDAVREGDKLVMDLQGRPTARFMFFNGMSYIRDKGEISYLENPYIEENLALSFQAQVAANEYYPGIARRIYLKAYRYNLHLRPKSMLVELGAQTNTVEEIMNACDPLAHIIAIVLSGEM